MPPYQRTAQGFFSSLFQDILFASQILELRVRFVWFDSRPKFLDMRVNRPFARGVKSIDCAMPQYPLWLQRTHLIS
jgi:hypothetical protein